MSHVGVARKGGASFVSILAQIETEKPSAPQS
jgi:hypothetical protein